MELWRREDSADAPASRSTVMICAAPKPTGKERDAELAGSAMQGNDYFGARYYGSSQGRFTSPDWSEKPAPIPYAKLTDPQTMNLYSYTRGNPLAHIDKDGHDLTVVGDQQKRYLQDLQRASGLTLTVNKKGKVTITNAPDRLSVVGREVSKIIGDQHNHVSIEARSAAEQVVGGAFMGNGRQILNYGSIDALSGKGGFSAPSIVTHETVEAYEGLQNGNNFQAAHGAALLFENLERVLVEGLPARIGESAVATPTGSRISVNFSFATETIDYNNRSGSITSVTVAPTNAPDLSKLPR